MKQFRHYPYLVTKSGSISRIGKTNSLKEDVLSKGYRRVTLSLDGKTERFLVHRIVAELYCDNPDNKLHVLHGDNCPSNNHYSNLRWGTHSENMLQCHQENRCSNLIASDKARELQLVKTNAKMKSVLEGSMVQLTYKHNRLHVEYYCKGCGGNYIHRVDSPSVSRGGICRTCFVSKGEDIV